MAQGFARKTIIVAGSSLESLVNGRLTLETGVPVSTTDQTAKTEVFFTPYKGNQIALYDGVSAWNVISFSEISIKVTDAQTGTTHNGTAVIDGLTDTSQLIVGMEVTGTGVGASAVIASIDSATQITLDTNSTADGTVTITSKVPASKNLDIFGFNNSGTAKLEMVQWTDDTTRATALATQDGVYVKTGATTRRYLGTVRTTATEGQTEQSFGSIAAGGGEAVLFVWNMYNRVNITAFVGDSTDSWVYSTSAWRAYNNSSTNRVSYVCGVATDSLLAIFTGRTTGSAASAGVVGVGVDVVNAFSHCTGTGLSNQTMDLPGRYFGNPGLGKHFISALEFGNGAAHTFYGDQGAPTTIQTGLHFSFLM